MIPTDARPSNHAALRLRDRRTGRLRRALDVRVVRPDIRHHRDSRRRLSAIQDLRRRYRLIGGAGVALVGAFVLFLALTAQEFQLFIGLPTVLLVWFMYVRPFMRTRYRRRVLELTALVDAAGRGRAVRLRDRPAPTAPDSHSVQSGGLRPVVLATLAVPFDADAYWVALDAATRVGRPADRDRRDRAAVLATVDREPATPTSSSRPTACVSVSWWSRRPAWACRSSTCACAARGPWTRCSRWPGSARPGCSCSAPTAAGCGRAVRPDGAEDPQARVVPAVGGRRRALRAPG